MDNLQKKFIEEATDNIQDLENALLQLEESPDDKELVERIFRALHTLKGTGAMFGFNAISEFTHDLENIYDLVREGQRVLDKEIICVTLQSVDHLRCLLSDASLSNAENVSAHGILLSRINDLLLDKSKEEGKIEETEQSAEKKQTYYISFQPEKELVVRGNNPLYIIDELTELGDHIVLPQLYKVPDLKDINPEYCYIGFEVVLSTSFDITAISDVFIFVEDECKLEIKGIADFDIFENKNIIKKIKELKASKKENYLENIQKLLKPLRSRSASVGDNSKANTKENLLSSIRVSSEKLDSLMNLVSELVTTQARLSLYAERNGKSELNSIAENVQKLSKQLRDIVFDIVLIPIETVITRFQRLVRDLSDDLSKKVRFITEGTETELDKTIMESLTDPILHILRNCIDHGIESPEERRRKGKPNEGTILLKAYYSGTNVVIEIGDDGVGIDPEKVKNKALKSGLITEDMHVDRSDLYDLLFLPGFSTTNKITDISGRGVGMDVVKRKIEEIRGEIKLDSEINNGTTITITLPLTLSIIDGLLVKIADSHYIIPLSAIDKIYAVNHHDIVSSFNNHLKLDGMLLPFFYLREEFNVSNENPLDEEQIILVQFQEKQVGIVVDYVVGEYQAVLKPLGKHYKKQEMISGASILGDGTVALVLDTNKLINAITYQNINMEDY